MGAVYVAHDERMRTRVALKVAAAGGFGADAFRARFALEARIGNLLGRAQRGIVRAFDWGPVDRVQLYLAMDLIRQQKKKGMEHIGGGTKTEKTIRTPGGAKPYRRADASFRDPRTGRITRTTMSARRPRRVNRSHESDGL